MDATRTRVDHLREMAEGAEQRMLSKTCADQNYAVLGRLRRELLAEIEELSQSGEKRTGLSEFERKLREREGAASKAPRRTAGR